MTFERPRQRSLWVTIPIALGLLVLVWGMRGDELLQDWENWLDRPSEEEVTYALAFATWPDCLGDGVAKRCREVFPAFYGDGMEPPPPLPEAAELAVLGKQLLGRLGYHTEEWDGIVDSEDGFVVAEGIGFEDLPAPVLEAVEELVAWHRRNSDPVLGDRQLPQGMRYLGDFLQSFRQRPLADLIPCEHPYWDAIWRVHMEVWSTGSAMIFPDLSDFWVCIEVLANRPNGLDQAVLREWPVDPWPVVDDTLFKLGFQARFASLGAVGFMKELFGSGLDEQSEVLSDPVVFEQILLLAEGIRAAEEAGEAWWLQDPAIDGVIEHPFGRDWLRQIMRAFSTRAELEQLRDILAQRGGPESLPAKIGSRDYRSAGMEMMKELPSFQVLFSED